MDWSFPPHHTGRCIVSPSSFLYAVLALLFLASCGKEKQEVVSTPTSYDASIPTEAEQEAFWTEHVKPIVIDELAASQYHIPEIRDRYAFLSTITNAHHRLQICAVFAFHPKSRDIIAGNRMSSDAAILEVYVPKLMKLWDGLRLAGETRWREQFELTVVVSVMHELDHLVDPQTGLYDDGSLETLVAKEKSAWAKTCEFTIAPLVEIYHLPLSPIIRFYYEGWVNTGRDEESKAWHEFIRKSHAPLREK